MKPATALGVMLPALLYGAVPGFAMPPPLPPPDQFEFRVNDDFNFICRRPDFAGPLVQCRMYGRTGPIWIDIRPEPQGFGYSMRNICVVDPAVPNFRYGHLPFGKLADTQLARDLAGLGTLPPYSDCKFAKADENQIPRLARLEQALAVYQTVLRGAGAD